MKISAAAVRKFQKTIFDYYRRHGRRFPWRETHDPYRILVSEMMLQQTQADRVASFFRKFIAAFPKVQTLARAPLRRVLQAWSGLGYNRRALFLKRAAEIIVREHGGVVPRDWEKLDALPGIGRDTAFAILVFAWNEPTVFIETNIRAVYLHFFFKNRRKVRDEEILEMVKRTLPHPSSILPEDQGRRLTVREWYDALMDYGAMLKKLHGNPNARSAHYTRQKKFAGSRRELRGEILRRAARQKTIAPGEFAGAAFSVPEVFADLANEGFLRREGRKFMLQK